MILNGQMDKNGQNITFCLLSKMDRQDKIHGFVLSKLDGQDKTSPKGGIGLSVQNWKSRRKMCWGRGLQSRPFLPTTFSVSRDKAHVLS